MALVPGARLGPYEIVSPLGVGGMGEVYRAKDTRLERVVAIKVLQNGITASQQTSAWPKPRCGRHRSMQSTQASPLLTEAGSTVGTVAYMSPEQLRGEDVDARTDLFSFGLVLYEMATGRPAFRGTTSAVIAAAILHEEPPAPREVRAELPERLEGMIVKTIERDRGPRGFR